MPSLIHNFFYQIFANDFIDVFFLAVSLISLSSLILATFLSIFKSNFDIKKRSFHFIVIFAVYLLCKAYFDNLEKPLPIKEVFLAINLLLSLPLFFIRVKQEMIFHTQDDLELEEIIDKEISKIEQDQVDLNNNKNATEEIIDKKDEQLNEDNLSGVSFSHVNSILERLNYYPLSDSDKGKMRELEVLLAQANGCEIQESLRLKINDGLGELLKIMSRYGV